MKRIKVIALALALSGLAACGGSGAADKGRPEDKTGIGRVVAEKSAWDKSRAVPAKTSAADSLRINAVRLSTDNLYANTDLTAEVEIAPPVPGEITLEYRWYVSNREVADANGPSLKSGSFRKHEWILCETRALTDGKESPWQKSNFVRAANSPPRVEPVAVEGFNVPGRFTYQVAASDVDNDDLAYELISPLDAGIELDKKSGLLTWQIDDKTIERLGETIVISLSVGDNDGQPTTGTLTLRFQKNITTQTP